MASLRRPSLRLTMGLAVAALTLLEMQGLVHSLRSQSRLSERVVRGVRDSVTAARPRLASLLLPGGASAWSQTCNEVLRLSLASEAEVFDRSGQALFQHPGPGPINHWPSPDELHAILNDSVFVVGPITRRYTRLLSYAAFRSGDQTIVLRLSTPMPELMADLADRRQLLLGHGLALVVLAIAGALVLFPTREDAAPAPQQAFNAYEEAMGRLRDRGAALEESLREKDAMARAGELTAGIAHEVRNGLGTIVGYARLLERDEAATDVADNARQIREECEILEGVVRRFMDYVRRETLHRTDFDLGRMLSRIVARECRSRPGAPVALPATDVGSLVGDEELLERALENLIRNAREAAGPEGRVSVEVSREAGAVSVRIADDGPGLPPDSPPDPRPFFTKKPGGLGLGLPLALKIIRLHQGELALENRQPHGLLASVRLPVAGSGG